MCSLAEKYFEMNKKQCREALDIYKRFLVRMERVSEFLKVAEVSFISLSRYCRHPQECRAAVSEESAVLCRPSSARYQFPHVLVCFCNPQ